MIFFAGALSQVCIEHIVLYSVGTSAVVVVLSVFGVILTCCCRCVAVARSGKNIDRNVQKDGIEPDLALDSTHQKTHLGRNCYTSSVKDHTISDHSNSLPDLTIAPLVTKSSSTEFC